MLSENSHEVSRDKLKFCKEEVEYLGRMLHGTSRSPAPAHVEAIRTAPKPQMVRQMLSFLGMVGYSRKWICDFTLKMAPSRL